MEDNFSKYLRLFGTILLSVILFLVVLALLMLGVKLIFGLLEYVPWSSYIFSIMILSVPVILFTVAYVIYFKRTDHHPSRVVKIISRSLFVIAILAWLCFYALDLITYFKNPRNQITTYLSFNMFFLAGNVTCLFLVGVMQALTAAKEIDWMERKREEEL